MLESIFCWYFVSLPYWHCLNLMTRLSDQPSTFSEAAKFTPNLSGFIHKSRFGIGLPFSDIWRDGVKTCLVSRSSSNPWKSIKFLKHKLFLKENSLELKYFNFMILPSFIAEFIWWPLNTMMTGAFLCQVLFIEIL